MPRPTGLPGRSTARPGARWKIVLPIAAGILAALVVALALWIRR